MFDVDLLVAFSFMALLFLRQVSISKEPNKINYAPLMIAIGAISSVMHFIMQPDVRDVILLLRESFFPLLVALLLYVVMNILHQTQVSQNARAQDEFTFMLITQMDQLKKFIAELEARMTLWAAQDREAQEEIREKFKKDINALDAIQTNQAKFLEKFEELEGWHKDVSKELEHFTGVQMPDLDNVVHKHIDIFRVAETEHFHQLKKMLESSISSKQNISQEMERLQESMQSMKSLSDDIAKAITRHTLQQLSGVTKSFEGEISALKSHAQGVKTSLSEGENTLGAIRVQSEMIMKQMVLSSTRMKELKEQNEGLYDIYSIIKELMSDIEAVKADYVKAQSQLSVISREFKEVENQQMEDMKKEIEALSTTLSKKIDDSLLKLHEHYHIAEEDITDSVKILVKKAQLQKGYQGLES
jgi:chromosome segregation ATPase